MKRARTTIGLTFTRLALAVLALAAMAVPQFSPAHAAGPGSVAAWGWNAYGQTGVPAGLTSVSAIAGGGTHSVALRSDGTVVAWGNDGNGQIGVPAGLANVTDVAAGFAHSLALKNDGTVVAWGSSIFGGSGVPAGLTDVGAIAAGAYHSLALMSDGTVVAWGWNAYGQASVPAGLTGVTAVAAGFAHSLALMGDGTVVAWGANDFGQSSIPGGLSDVIAVAAGQFHNLALKSDGTIVAWGYNAYGQSSVPTGLSSVTAIAAGGEHSLALKNDGTVAAWGDNAYGQSSVPAGLSSVTAIAAGRFHSLAIAPGDTTPPSASPAAAGTQGSNGWYTSDVTVSWNWIDNTGGSGIDTVRCADMSASNAEGSAVVVGAECYDLAGNRGTASVTLKIDKTPPAAAPSASPASNGAGWNNSDVTVTWNWTDSGGSGIDSANCPASSASSGEGILSLSAMCKDLAGNTGASPAVIVQIDKTPPNVTVDQATEQADPTASDPVLYATHFSEPVDGFTAADVTLGGTADLAHAVIEVSGGPSSYSIAVSGLAGNGTVTAAAAADIATDAAGNGNTPSTSTDNTVAFISDSTPPAIIPNVVGMHGSNDWYVGDVTVSWSVTDPESAVTSTSGCEQQTVGADTIGITFTCSATSDGGTDSKSVTIKRDVTAPVFGACPAAESFVFNTGVQAVGPIDVDAAISGIAASTLSGLVDTSSAGTKMVTFSVTDNAGSTATKQCSYTVTGYSFAGYFAPVDNPPVLNRSKAGQSIPVKFSLGGDYGLAVLAPNSPTSIRITCPGGVLIDPIPETATVSNSSLTYDPTANQYTYVWKTDKAWAGMCRQLNVILADGTTRSAGFSFTR